MHFALVRLRPNREPVSGINQFRGNTDKIAVTPNASLQHMIHVESLRNLRQFGLLSPEPKRRAPCGYSQAIDFCQRCQYFLSNSVAEIRMILPRT